METRTAPPKVQPIRARIECAIELLIAELDRIDGDPDVEGCGAEDDFVLGDVARLGLGCPLADPGERRPPLRPTYGVDQSRGPINNPDADRVWRNQQQAGVSA